MKDKVEAYVEIAKEIDKIMTKAFGEHYDSEILQTYSALALNEKELDKFMEAHGITSDEKGYDMTDEDIHKIAYDEVMQQVNHEAPCEIEAFRVISSINNEVAEVHNSVSELEMTAEDNDIEKLSELYSDILNRLDSIHDIYYANREVLGIEDEKYQNIVDKINDIKEQVEELSQATELDTYEKEEKGSGLLQQLREVTPTFKEEPIQDEREQGEL